MHPSEKVVSSLGELEHRCSLMRAHGKTIVLTSGCFDLLHGGHLEYIWDAGKRGFLVVGINSDTFVKKLKGESRPVRDEGDRALVMAGFYPVGLVVVFNCDYQLIDAVRPDIYVASSTSHVRIWKDERRVSLLRKIGAQIVELGGKKVDSTTAIISRMNT